MKKSQLITLVILFVAVSIFIWVGACSEDTSNVPDPNSTISVKVTSSGQTKVPTASPEPTAKPTPAPLTEADFTMLNALSGEQLNVVLNRITGKLANSETELALQGYKYSDSIPGSDSKDIYISFMLHETYVNSGVERILDLAENENLKFSFFVSSAYIANPENEETIRKIYNAGHTIGSRGVVEEGVEQHSLNAETLAEIFSEMNKRFAEIVGDDVRLQFYSPDTFSQRSFKLANLMGCTAVLRFDIFETDKGSRNVYNGVHYQAFGADDGLVEQLTSYVEWLKSEGYTFKAFKGE